MGSQGIVEVANSEHENLPDESKMIEWTLRGYILLSLPSPYLQAGHDKRFVLHLGSSTGVALWPDSVAVTLCGHPYINNGWPAKDAAMMCKTCEGRVQSAREAT